LDRYDSIIIGAGHNGLVCATYLARRGQRVLLVEASASPGGLGASREFHDGFRAPIAHSASHFPQEIARDLKLSSHGFEAPGKSIPTIGLGASGTHVVVDESGLTGGAEGDAKAYQAYSELMSRFADALAPFWLKTMPRIAYTGLSNLRTFAHLGLNLRRMGRQDMREFLRVFSLPVRDLMDEYFESELVKGTLSWDALLGSKLAPRSPNNAVLTMLYRWAGGSGGAHTMASGGGLIPALLASAKTHGVEIRCGQPVDQILIVGGADGLSATGVKLGSGEEIGADNIISSADPKNTFLNLVGVQHLDIGFTNQIRRLRCDGYVGKLHLALDGLPEFEGVEQPSGRMIIAPGMDAIEIAFDEAKYGQCPAHPVMEIFVPSLHDSSLAPQGKHLLSAHVMYVPYRLKDGWSQTARDSMCENAMDAIARYAPRIREQTIHREFLTPQDLESEYRVTGGHWHHTELALDQMLMMRPTYGAAQYRTPIPGLFLCGAGCHPGGDLTGAAGHNAARQVLQ
jgi:phytoene dehydrogenase-like protein